MELRPPAFDKAILEEPADFEQFKDLDYNRLLRDGRQTEFAPLMNFVVCFSMWSFYHAFF